MSVCTHDELRTGHKLQEKEMQTHTVLKLFRLSLSSPLTSSEVYPSRDSRNSPSSCPYRGMGAIEISRRVALHKISKKILSRVSSRISPATSTRRNPGRDERELEGEAKTSPSSGAMTRAMPPAPLCHRSPVSPAQQMLRFLTS